MKVTNTNAQGSHSISALGVCISIPAGKVVEVDESLRKLVESVAKVNPNIKILQPINEAPKTEPKVAAPATTTETPPAAKAAAPKKGWFGRAAKAE